MYSSDYDYLPRLICTNTGNLIEYIQMYINEVYLFSSACAFLCGHISV